MRRLASLAVVLLWSCATPPSPEARAERLRAQLHREPGSLSAEQAEEGLATLEYERACQLHTVLGYKRFLEQFPNAPQADDARARLEALRFNAAKERHAAAAWRQFLAEHPSGTHAEEARTLLAKAELEEAPRAGGEDTLRRLAQANDGTTAGAQAADRLDDAAFAQAMEQGASGLRGYLREFPAGRHREAAQVELLSRTLDALLFAGEVVAAREEAGRNPLAQRLTDLEARFERADLASGALQAKSEAVRAVLPGYYLRPVEDLRRALLAPDPLDRWQAAEELGEHVSPRAIEPLLEAIRSGRHPLIRERAFDSLLKITQALPPRIAEYVLSERAEALPATGDTPQALLLQAVLAEASGQRATAATLYQKAFNTADPDPLILRRTIALRQAQAQHFSSAVAARQLARWALETAQANDPAAPGFGGVWATRLLCAAVEEARFAERAIERAKGEVSEFPQDLEAFLIAAVDARRLAEARLADAERALKREDRHALSCDDRRVADRLEEAARLRLNALGKVRQRAPDLAGTVLRLASERDPSPQVRERARGLLAGSAG